MIAHVQTQSAGGTSTTASVGPFTYTAGNAVIVSLIFNVSKASVGTITQTVGDTVGALHFENDTAGSDLVQFSADNVAGGSTTFTFTFTSTSWRMFTTEISGQKTTNPFDVSATTAQTTSTTHSTGTTGTLAQAEEIAIALFNGDGSGTTAFSSATNGFTVPTNGDQLGIGGVPVKGMILYLVTSSTSGVETTITTDNMIASGSIGTYKGASASPITGLRPAICV